MEKAQEILFHIDELYTENPSEEKILQLAEKNPTRYQAWVDAFKDYDLSYVLQAIDEYWEYKSSKTKPNVAQIKAILNAHKTSLVKETAAPKKELPSPEKFMADDIKTGDCRNNLYVYRDAFEICLKEFLPQVIPADIAEHSYYPKDVQLAVENGVFFRFGEAMLMAAHRRFGENRDYEFSSENDLKAQKQNSASHTMTGQDAVNIISAHWRA